MLGLPSTDGVGLASPTFDGMALSSTAAASASAATALAPPASRIGQPTSLRGRCARRCGAGMSGIRDSRRSAGWSGNVRTRRQTSVSASRIWALARDSQLATVPGGTWSIMAISACVYPSTALRRSAARCSIRRPRSAPSRPRSSGATHGSGSPRPPRRSLHLRRRSRSLKASRRPMVCAGRPPAQGPAPPRGRGRPRSADEPDPGSDVRQWQ